MNFDWTGFTEEKFENLITNNPYDYIGSVHVGDISIDLINHPDINLMLFDFYVLNEDTGYGYTENNIPYDYAEGNEIELWKIHNISYEEFKEVAERYFKEFISGNCQPYSLAEHANRPLVMW